MENKRGTKLKIYFVAFAVFFTVSVTALKIFLGRDVQETDNSVVVTNTIAPSSFVEITPSVVLPTDQNVTATPVNTIIVVSVYPTSTPVTPTNTPIPPTNTPGPEYPSATVAFYADTQSDSDAEDVNHTRVVNYILARGANPVFHAGDLMEDGTEDSWNRFLNVTTTLRSSRTFYAALGNNDRLYGDSSTPSPFFLNGFSFPNNERWYSINWGNLHMVVLDSAFAASNGSQISWLINDLQSAASQDRITGVMFHHPSYASTVQSYLNEYNVDFVIMGHNHTYQHYESNGVHYFVTSGQPNIGYLLARIYSDRASITVYNSSNGVITTIGFDER